MTALPPQSSFDVVAGPKDFAREGHLFRSKLIDKLSLVEAWACRILNDASKLGAECAGQEHLLGKRLGKVRELAASEPSRFKNAARVISLLDRLRPYADMRSNIAHSTLHFLPDEGRPSILIFEPALVQELERSKRRVSLRVDELDPHFRSVSIIANELSQQKLATPASTGPAS